MASQRKPVQKAEAVLNEYQQAYEDVVIHRSELKDALYNPRKITTSARRNLKRVIAKLGMVQPFVWNVRSGNLVSGHQRLSVMDSLKGTADYLVKVARVDVDDKTEKQLNLAINNPSVQGDWDLGKLETMLPEVDLEDAGFNLEDVYRVFGHSPFVEKPGEFKEVADRMRKIKDSRRRKSKG
jgi:hypothetical protein